MSLLEDHFKLHRAPFPQTAEGPALLNHTALKEALERRFGKKIEARVTVDPALIGGARIVVGDTVIDGSVHGGLQAMASHLRT